MNLDLFASSYILTIIITNIPHFAKFNTLKKDAIFFR